MGWLVLFGLITIVLFGYTVWRFPVAWIVLGGIAGAAIFLAIGINIPITEGIVVGLVITGLAGFGSGAVIMAIVAGIVFLMKRVALEVFHRLQDIK